MKNKNKKGVILLITIFFITAISILINKHLEDSEQFIKEVSIDNSLIQIKISNKNIEKEIISLVKQYSNDINSLVQKTVNGVSIKYQNIDINFNLDIYTPSNCYLKDIDTKEKLFATCKEDTTNYISNPNFFVKILKKYKDKLDSKEKLNFFIREYKNKTKDIKIENIKNNFEYIKFEDNQIILKCAYVINANNTKAKGSFLISSNNQSIFDNSLILVEDN
jgi:hypothetical protein